jgi:hypothetical protein
MIMPGKPSSTLVARPAKAATVGAEHHQRAKLSACTSGKSTGRSALRNWMAADQTLISTGAAIRHVGGFTPAPREHLACDIHRCRPAEP